MNMIEKKEIRNLNLIAARIIHSRLLKKIKKIESDDEKIHSLKYLIKVALDMKIHNLERKIKKLEKENKDVFVENMKFHILKSKLKIFYATFHRVDFKKVENLSKDIEKDLKNVVWIV